MQTILNIFKIPELRSRLLFTLGMLAIYRVGIFITTPGVDRNVMHQIMAAQSGTFLGMFNLFSGGALKQLSIFALGIMPYVSASIILSLMGAVVPHLEELRKEGEAGRRKLNQYTRYGCVGLSVVQSTGIALFLEGLNSSQSNQFGDVVITAPPAIQIFVSVTNRYLLNNLVVTIPKLNISAIIPNIKSPKNSGKISCQW